MKKVLVIIGAIVMLAAVALMSVGFGWVSIGVGNAVSYVGQKIDDLTNYETLKEVEDTCRAMISSYESDKIMYEQYKNSTGEQKQWSDAAKIRANKTAVSYNNYILKNSFVWRDAVPADIKTNLSILE